jgi:hypothetical protein
LSRSLLSFLKKKGIEFTIDEIEPPKKLRSINVQGFVVAKDRVFLFFLRLLTQRRLEQRKPCPEGYQKKMRHIQVRYHG